MENREIKLTFKEYSLLERSIRGDVSLSYKLCGNQPISKNELIMELLEEICDFEYDEGEETPLEYRLYEDGRNLLRTITEKIYHDGTDRYIKFSVYHRSRECLTQGSSTKVVGIFRHVCCGHGAMGFFR